MRIQQATDLAAWVNTHDDGTPQPRASVIPVDMPDGAPWAYRVDILSTVYSGGQAHHVETEQAHNLQQARDALGY